MVPFTGSKQQRRFLPPLGWGQSEEEAATTRGGGHERRWDRQGLPLLSTSSTAATCFPMGESRAPWPPCRASSRPPRRGGRPTRRPRRASRAARPQTEPPRRPRRASRATPRRRRKELMRGERATGEGDLPIRRARPPRPYGRSVRSSRSARHEQIWGGEGERKGERRVWEGVEAPPLGLANTGELGAPTVSTARWCPRRRGGGARGRGGGGARCSALDLRDRERISAAAVDLRCRDEREDEEVGFAVAYRMEVIL